MRSTSIAFFTNGPAPGDTLTPGAGPIHTAKCANVVAGQLVGLELDGAGDPAALGRRRVHDDFFVRRRGAARERASVRA